MKGDLSSRNRNRVLEAVVMAYTSHPRQMGRMRVEGWAGSDHRVWLAIGRPLDFVLSDRES